MDEFCLFINSEDSLSTFANNVGGNFKVRLPKRYTLDGSWECALLEVSFIPELEVSTRRMYFCSDFVHQSYVRETALPILQSIRLLNEDITDVTFEKPIYFPVTRNELYHIEFVLRDDHLQMCRLKDDHVFLLLHFRRKNLLEKLHIHI